MDDVTGQLKPFGVSITETARLLGLGHKPGGGRSSVNELLARGELEAVKDGSRTIVTLASIERRAASRPKAVFKPLPPAPQARRPMTEKERGAAGDDAPLKGKISERSALNTKIAEDMQARPPGGRMHLPALIIAGDPVELIFNRVVHIVRAMPEMRQQTLSDLDIRLGDLRREIRRMLAYFARDLLDDLAFEVAEARQDGIDDEGLDELIRTYFWED